MAEVHSRRQGDVAKDDLCGHEPSVCGKARDRGSIEVEVATSRRSPGHTGQSESDITIREGAGIVGLQHEIEVEPLGQRESPCQKSLSAP